MASPATCKAGEVRLTETKTDKESLFWRVGHTPVGTDLKQLPWNEFDLVVAIEILECVRDPPDLLRLLT